MQISNGTLLIIAIGLALLMIGLAILLMVITFPPEQTPVDLGNFPTPHLEFNPTMSAALTQTNIAIETAVAITTTPCEPARGREELPVLSQQMLDAISAAGIEGIDGSVRASGTTFDEIAAARAHGLAGAALLDALGGLR